MYLTLCKKLHGDRAIRPFIFLTSPQYIFLLFVQLLYMGTTVS